MSLPERINVLKKKITDLENLMGKINKNIDFINTFMSVDLNNGFPEDYKSLIGSDLRHTMTDMVRYKESVKHSLGNLKGDLNHSQVAQQFDEAIQRNSKGKPFNPKDLRKYRKPY